MERFTDLQREALARHLRKHLRGEVRFDQTTRRLYSTDASIYQMEPLGVVIPRTVEDVVCTVQIAAEAHVALTPRGGGTSLSGQSIGPGIVLDCSKYLHDVLDVDPVGRRVRVQPGVILDELNRIVAAHGLQFGPEVATSSRANLAGMIGNNSAGARSIVYGKTIDHVLRLDVILADGRRARLGPMDIEEWDRHAAGTSLEASIYRKVRAIVRQNHDEIRRRFPHILRRVSGYNLDAVNAGLFPTANDSAPPAGLHQLVVGSEGTLAVIAEAELNLLPRPKTRGLLVPQFRTLAAAMDALDACLDFKPSAVELLDHYLLELTAQNLALRDTMQAIRGNPQAVFMVEFSGDDPTEVADRVEKLRQRLHEVPGLTAAVAALDPAEREPLWNLRRAAMPLLYGMRGDRKPVTFVEDTAVAPERLPEFVGRFRGLLQSHGTDGAFYGHASVGCLHIRPLLNLKDPNDVARMRRISDAVTNLVLEYGGALSGEHGDGLARSEWNARMFGPAIYRAFLAVKEAFDPQGILNPGRVVNGPPMTENLRYPPGYAPYQPATIFDYSSQEGFVRSVEMCNGSGACRKVHGGTMCPSYRATLDEHDSTRGRANALRLALTGEDPLRELRDPRLLGVFDLCLMCKACKAECPSNVDVAKLKAEFLHLYYQDRPRPLGHRLIARLPQLNRLAAPFAPVVNWLQQRGFLRWLMEKIAGIDRRRSLPVLHRDHFRRWFQRHRPAAGAGRRGKVFLMADCFTTYNEPAIGQAAVRVLEQAGYRVELADMVCCGRTLLSKGFLPEARTLVQTQAPALAERLSGGTPLLGMEPSCVLTLADEWKDLIPGPVTQAVAKGCHLVDGWLAREVAAGRTELPLTPRTGECLLHTHCHQKALVGAGGSAAALRLVPELKVTVLDAGCCGMAGSFGFEREHFDLSARIAGLALLPALEKAPDALVAATGTSCRHQVHDLAGRIALHPMQVLDQQLA
jgi:FAD/FMN-containing dehydrogenase/Fe-S oxidoreductase